MAAVCAGLLILGTAPGAWAQEPSAMQSARDAVDMLEHAEALKHLDKAHADAATPPQDRATAHWLAATCHLALGRKKEMTAELEKLLALHPLFEPRDDEGPPEVVKEYRKRAKKWREDHTVTIAEPTFADGVTTAILEKNDKEVAAARLRYRAKGEATFQDAPLKVEGTTLTGELGTPEFRTKAQDAGGAEFYVQTLTRGGMPNGQWGSETQPKSVEMTPAPKKEEPRPAEKPVETKVQPAASTGAGGKAIGVGVAMLVVGLLTGLPAMAFTVAGIVTFVVGVLQANGGANTETQQFRVLRVASNSLNVLGPAMGVASITLLVFGVLVAVLLR